MTWTRPHHCMQTQIHLHLSQAFISTIACTYHAKWHCMHTQWCCQTASPSFCPPCKHWTIVVCPIRAIPPHMPPHPFIATIEHCCHCTVLMNIKNIHVELLNLSASVCITLPTKPLKVCKPLVTHMPHPHCDKPSYRDKHPHCTTPLHCRNLYPQWVIITPCQTCTPQQNLWIVGTVFTYTCHGCGVRSPSLRVTSDHPYVLQVWYMMGL